jgi:FAD/FMN-containing dehydrogenase
MTNTRPSGSIAIERELSALAAVLEGNVVLPDSPVSADLRRSPWAQYAGVRPVAVIRCRTAADIGETVAFAKRLRLQLAIRSGGHCFAGLSSTRGLLIDLSAMSSVTVSESVAVVGAGALLGAIDDSLDAHDRAIVAGACPSVGVGGLTLGGGLGILGRSHGLTCDRLLEADVVLANGGVITCDEQQDADLFWALRGGGAGRLGVVTSFTFRTIRPPQLTCFRLDWPAAHAPAVIEDWQAFAPSAPDELAVSVLFNVGPEPGDAATVSVFGAMRGGHADTERALEQFVTRQDIGPDSVVIIELPYRAAKHWLAEHAPGAEGDVTAAGEVPGQPLLYVRSDFFREPIPGPAIAGLVEHALRERPPGQARELDFTPWGGAYNRVPPEATAFVHRRELFLLKHAVTLPAEAPAADRVSARRWVDESWTPLRGHASGGVFPNFADPQLTDADRAYYGSNERRLRRVTATYDPNGVFTRSPAA